MQGSHLRASTHETVRLEQEMKLRASRQAKWASGTSFECLWEGGGVSVLNFESADWLGWASSY